MRLALALTITLLLAASAPAAAQVVVSAQPLDFGQLIGGVTEVVTPTDVIRRADVAMQGSTNGDVSLSLVLPTHLRSASGNSIPLQFFPGDAVYRNFSGQMQTVSLTGSTTVRLHRTQTTHLYLGGRALPALGQRAGVYSATVVVILAPPGA